MLHWFSLPCQIVYLTVWHGTPKPKHRWHICEKKEKGNKFFYYTIKHVKIQKFFKIAFDCNLESNANSCPKALGIGKSSKDIEGGNVSKILDAANDCSELTNCKIYILYSNSSNVPRQNRVAHKNLNHQAWMPSKYCDLLFTLCILSNKCTGTNYRILRKNLDQGSMIIFDQWKLFCLIDLIPSLLYEVKPDIRTIKKNNFHWSKIIVEPCSRFFRNLYWLD